MNSVSAEAQVGRQTAAAFSRAAVIVVASYVAAQMLADIASLKIGVVFGLAVDMGTFVYPATFTLRDMVHKQLGKSNAQTVIIVAAAVNLVMAAYLAWAASVPSDPAWGLGEAFSAILGPVWRIVLASIAAEVVSELTDTEVYHWFVTRITTRFQWARVLVSNSISMPIDTAVFTILAFAPLPGLADHPLTVPWEVVWQIFVFNMLIKFAVTLVSMPLIYFTPDRDWSADADEA